MKINNEFIKMEGDINEIEIYNVKNERPVEIFIHPVDDDELSFLIYLDFEDLVQFRNQINDFLKENEEE